jgi:ubiquinone/menaquinone biosynthesis C-methylase UbiE
MSTTADATTDIYARIKAAWDQDAARYDRRPGHGILSDRERAAWRQMLAGILDPLQAGVPLRIADVGTGTGSIALLLADMGNKVTAVDLSPAMLDKGRLKAELLGLDMQFVEANAIDLPLDTSSVDVVISRHLFWTLPKPVETLREWVRVVRPGGIVAVADGWWNEPTATMAWRRAVGTTIRRVLPGHHTGHPGYADLHRDLPVVGGVSPYTIRYYLDQAGLERLKVRDLRRIRAAERRSTPPWFWIDMARFTWLASGYKPM